MSLFKVDANTLFGWSDKKQLDLDAKQFVNSIESAFDNIEKLSEEDKKDG